MWPVTFEEWVSTLRKSAEKKSIELSTNNEAYRKNYEQGETPKGTLSLIIEFGEN